MGQRKQRSDKKREVKPYLHMYLKDMIYRLSYITHTPVKDICEFMCVHVMSNRKAIDMLSTQFKRDIRLDNMLYRGLPDNVSAKKRVDGPSQINHQFHFQNRM